MNHLFKKLQFLLILIALTSINQCLFSQDVLTDKEFVRKIAGYNALYKQEKAYIHTDKPIYFAGEDIWLSGFLVNADNLQLNTDEKVLYIELLKPNGKIANKAFYKLENGRTKGCISLDESLEPGNYLLVAYTNWMRNAGSEFFFKKPLIILNDTPTNEAIALQEDTINASPTVIIHKSANSTTPQLNLKFYPEGGDLIAGLISKIAFEATDENGANITVAGSIIDDNKNTVASLNTLWKGRGYFTLQPLEGKQYRAQIVTTDGKSQTFELPEIKSFGYSLKIETSPNSPNYFVTIARKLQQPANKAFLLVMQNQKPIYALSDTLSDAPKTFSVPKKIFKSGIAHFTLFDDKKIPRCERLCLINKNDAIQLSVIEKTIQVKQRGKVSLQLQAKDKEGNPVSGSFAVAITDAKRIDEEGYPNLSFANYLNFGADIPHYKGDISELLEPGMKGMIRSELLMLTSGWRRYKWDEVLKEKTALPYYKKEPGIYLKGQIYKNENKKRVPPEGLDITMFIPKRIDAYNQTTDDQGEFSFLIRDFYGAYDAVIQTKNRMNVKKDYLIDLETNLKARPKGLSDKNNIKQADENSSMYYTGNPLDTSIYAEKGSLEEQLQRAIDFNFYLDTTDVTLEEYTVVADKARNAKSAIINRYGPAERSIGSKQIKDIAEKKKWHSGLFDLIEDAIPGLMIDYNPIDESIRFTPKDRRRHRFFVYIDGEMIGASNDNGLLQKLLSLYEMYELTNFDPDLVEAIDLIYPPKEKNDPTADHETTAQYSIDATASDEVDINDQTVIESGEDAIGDAMREGPTVYTSPTAILSIYTKEGIGLSSQKHFKGIMNIELTGYAKIKEYYSPNYSTTNEIIKADQRTTLFWNPELIIDSTGTRDITFYNSDLGHQFRIDAVGISNNGQVGDLRQQFGSATPLYTATPNAYDPMEMAIDVKYDPVWSSESKMKIMVYTPEGKPATGADISTNDGSWGNITNSEGAFYLDKDAVAKNELLLISYKGDAFITAKASELTKGNKSITLQPLSLSPSEEDIDKLPRKLLRELFNNKPSRSTYPNAIYREEVYWGDELHRMLDLSLTLRVPGIKQGFETYAIDPKAGQLYKTNKYDNKAVFAPRINSVFSVHTMDPLFQKLTFLDVDYLKYYDFKLDGQTKFRNRNVLKLSFDQKTDAPYSMQKGFMLIDVITYGIVYLEWGASPKGDEYLVQDSYIIGKKRHDDFKLLSDKNSATYQLINNKWEIKSGLQEVQFSYNNKSYSYNREIIATGYAKDQEFKFRPLPIKEMENRFVLIKSPKYNLQNWRDPWFIPSTDKIQKNIPFMHEVQMLKGK